MRRLITVVLALACLSLAAVSVGAWWTPQNASLRPITAHRYEIVPPDGTARGLFDGQWQAAFPAKAQTCEFAVRDALVRAERDGWDISAAQNDLRKISTEGGNRSPCYVALYVR